MADVRNCFINTYHRKGKNDSNTSNCDIGLSKHINATHFRMISASIPNTGYSFTQENNKLRWFRFYDTGGGVMSTYITSNIKTEKQMDTVKRYTFAELLTKLNDQNSAIEFTTTDSYKIIAINKDNNDSYMIEANPKIGLPTDMTLTSNQTKQFSHMADLTSTKCVYVSSQTLVADTVCSENKGEKTTTDSCIFAQIQFSSANALGDLASYANTQTDWLPISNAEASIGEIQIRLLNDKFQGYDTNGVDSQFHMQFVNFNKQPNTNREIPFMPN